MHWSSRMLLRLSSSSREAEATSRRQGLLVGGEQLQQLELFQRGESRRVVVDAPGAFVKTTSSIVTGSAHNSSYDWKQAYQDRDCTVSFFHIYRQPCPRPTQYTMACAGRSPERAENVL